MVRQERAVRTREALIRSAAEVFHHEGFTAASLTLISSRAGVSNGALHFHFASKAVLADAVEHAAAGVLQTITGPGPGPAPALVTAPAPAVVPAPVPVPAGAGTPAPCSAWSTPPMNSPAGCSRTSSCGRVSS